MSTCAVHQAATTDLSASDIIDLTVLIEFIFSENAAGRVRTCSRLLYRQKQIQRNTQHTNLDRTCSKENTFHAVKRTFMFTTDIVHTGDVMIVLNISRSFHFIANSSILSAQRLSNRSLFDRIRSTQGFISADCRSECPALRRASFSKAYEIPASEKQSLMSSLCMRTRTVR